LDILQDIGCRVRHVYVKIQRSKEDIDGITTFQTSNGSLKIIYQKRYGTGWIDEGKWVEDQILQ
jgi:hypothetical protein